jgi:hypothetical protein
VWKISYLLFNFHFWCIANILIHVDRRSALFGPPGEVVKLWAGMATQTIAETAQKIVTPETLRYAAKQSQRCLTVPLRLRRAIKKYLRGPLFFLVLLFHIISICIDCIHIFVIAIFHGGLGIIEQEEPYMKRKVLRLSQSFNEIKNVNLQLATTTSREIVEDPLKSSEQSKRWKITSSYGDIGLTYRDDETIAYVASRMPAVYSACYRVLKEVGRKQNPDWWKIKKKYAWYGAHIIK